MIHGPQTIIDVIHNTVPMNKTEQLNEVFQNCQKRMSDFLSLFNKAKYFTSKFFVLDPKEDPFYTHLVQQINNLRTKIGVAVNSREQNFYSTEFAACFINVVFSDMDTKMLRYLYNVISRARAFCYIIVVGDEKTDKAQLNEFLGIFMEAKVNHINPAKVQDVIDIELD